MLPATEWICSHLASACGLPVPPVAAVELVAQPGIHYFGSQWQGGSHDYLSAMGRISNTEIFAKTHAVDLFVHNIDRHHNNFLYLDLAGEIVARVIDFSHALLVMGWPLPGLPMEVCNTTQCLPALLGQHQGPYTPPTEIIDKIARLEDGWLFEQISSMPLQWLSDEMALRLGVWWLGEERKSRLTAAQLALP